MTATQVPPEAAARYRSIRNVLWIVFVLNISVAAAKLLYGLLTHSAAMQADGLGSFFDGATCIVGLFGMWFAVRPADKSHQYGHAKFETFTAAAIAVTLLAGGYTVLRGAIENLLGRGAPTEVGAGSFVVMLATVAVNVFVVIWETRAGRRLGSEVLIADSRPTLIDVAVSLGVIVSLVLVKLGLARADGVVAVLAALVFLPTAVGLIRSIGRTLSDAARLPAADVEEVARAIPGVSDCHTVRTRGLERRVYVDLHLVVSAEETVEGGHGIAHAAEEALRARYAEIADVVVHIEPAPR